MINNIPAHYLPLTYANTFTTEGKTKINKHSASIHVPVQAYCLHWDRNFVHQNIFFHWKFHILSKL